MHRSAALLASLVLLLAGCGSAGADGGDGGDASGSGGGAAGTGAQVDYNFTAETLEGGTFEGTSLKGKPAVLWFWAPWCPTCRAQIPNVSNLAKTYDGEVAVIGVGGLDSGSAISDLAETIKYVTHVVDDEGTMWKHFGVTEQSTYTVIDADGKVVSEGYLDDADLNDLVAELAEDAG